MKIGTLLSCHNRREKTLVCLNALYEVTLPPTCQLYVFLVDDGSTDGTGEAVKKQFPEVNVIQGTGNLFWNRGMRLAWETAAKEKDYDYYLWLNDDTILDKTALSELFSCTLEVYASDKKSSIIVGACREEDKNTFSYGGRNDNGPVIPNGKLQTCKYINGNVVLVPKEVYEKIGYLSSEYQHTLGDYDYGLRVVNASFKCYTTKKYIATCPSNGEPDWCNPDVPISKRISLFYSPKGLNIKDYIRFRKKFFGRKWISFALKAYLRVLFPAIYNRFRTNKI